MSGYWWQPETFPVDETTPLSWKHFEAIRMHLWLKTGHLDAGVDPTDYTTPATGMFSDDGRGGTQAWADYVSGLSTDLFPMQPGSQYVKEIIYFGPGQSRGDRYTTYEPFLNKSVMAAHPPVKETGVVDSAYWRYAADPNRYRDYDKCSGRYMIDRDARTGGAPKVCFVDLPAWRWLPAQVDPKRQRPWIHYLNNDRKIPHRQSVEISKRHISQPDTMSAEWDMMYGSTDLQPAAHYTKLSNFSSDDVYAGGKQYAIIQGQPGQETGGAGDPASAPTNSGSEVQFYFDPKICNAYQNMIERTANFGNWCWPIDVTTDWGAVWIANYEAEQLAPYQDAPDWVAGTYNNGDTVKHIGRIWTAKTTTTQEPAIGASQWDQITYLYGDQLSDSISAPMTDHRWGCNGSAFELALWIIGEYDWILDMGHPWVDEAILILRYEAAQGSPPLPTQEEIDTAYPVPYGTWRRTWKRTFGVPRGYLLWPSEKGDPDGDTYSEYQEATANIPDPTTMHMSGLYCMVDPEIELTGPDLENVAERHEEVFTEDENLKYRMKAGIINDMWDVLENLKYHYGTDISLTLQSRTGAGSGIAKSTKEAAYQDAKSGAVSNYNGASWGNQSTARVKWDGYMQAQNSGASVQWTSWMWRRGAALLLSGGKTDGRYYARSIMVKLKYTEQLYTEIDYDSSELNEFFDVGFPDGQMRTFKSEYYLSTENPEYNTITIDLGTDAFDGTDEKRFEILSATDPPPIAGIEPAPAPSNYFWALYNAVSFSIASTSLDEQSVYFELDLDKVPESVFEDLQYVEFTEREADSEKFDDDGMLI